MRVSAIIPAMNEEKTLARAVASLRMGGVPVEVVVVVNGSTDGTVAVARKVADRVVLHLSPLGVARARNMGASVAHGSLLIFLDADSYVVAGTVASIVASARSQSYGTVLGEGESPRLRLRLYFAMKRLFHRTNLYQGCLGGCYFVGRRLFDSMGGFDYRSEPDEFYDFNHRAKERGGRYLLVEGGTAITSTRRFEHLNLIKALRFWARLRLATILHTPARSFYRDYWQRRQVRP